MAVVAILGMLKSFSPNINIVDPTPTPDPNPIVDPTPDPDPVVDPVITVGRDKRYKAKGNGQDSVTVMIYMCGTDLESNYGMATSDLVEMTNATIADNVNVIVETGGCKKWKNSIVSNSTNQIYRVVSGGVEPVDQNHGAASMVKPGTLSDFVKFCSTNYPADRNILIFWDHGGGSLTGYGYDEKMGGNDSMTLDEINAALKEAGCVFDWIGFDACLMATYETATVANNYADYLIASEESEPGTGWYYTGWLNQLSKNTSIDTVTLGKTICDDFVTASLQASSRTEVTLSVVDLAEMQGTAYNAFNSWSSATTNMIKGSNYSTVSNARAGVRQFAASSRLNQVDLVDLSDRIGTTESKALAKALRSCIKYNKTNMNKAYGLSIYFPYESMSSVNSALNTFNAIKLDNAYSECIRSFASLASGGQIGHSSGYGYGSSYGGSSIDLSSLLGYGSSYGGSSSGSSYNDYGSSYGNSYSSYGADQLLGTLLGGYSNNSGYSSSGYNVSASDILGLLSGMGGRSIGGDYSWVDTGLVASSAEYISKNYIDPGDIFVQKKGDHRILTLTDEQWNLIQTVELNIFVDDGDGYIDLGLDNVFDMDGNDLYLDYDNTWLTVNGHTVAYYLVSDIENEDGSYTTTGRIPVMLTTTDVDGEEVTLFADLKVLFDSENPRGVITGVTTAYVSGNGTTAKGDMPVKKGDVLQFLCDYYTYDGELDATYKLGEPITVGSDGLSLANMDLGDVTCSVTYRLTDIYGNHFWTPAYTTD